MAKLFPAFMTIKAWTSSGWFAGSGEQAVKSNAVPRIARRCFTIHSNFDTAASFFDNSLLRTHSQIAEAHDVEAGQMSNLRRENL